MEFEYIVLDESQYIKNKDSKVFKVFNQLEGLYKFLFSGILIENLLLDFWVQMQFINFNLLGSFNFFKKEFICLIEWMYDEDKKNQFW